MSDMDDTNTGLAKAGDTKEKDTGGSNRKSLPDYYAIGKQNSFSFLLCLFTAVLVDRDDLC